MGGDNRRGPLRRLRERSSTVRVRTTVGAVVVVGIALVVAAVAMVVLLRRSLTNDVRTAARFRALAVANVVETGPYGPIRVGDSEDEFVQVLDNSGSVVATSANLRGRPAVIDLAPGESEDVEVPFEDDPFLAIALSDATGGQTYTIVAGRTLETVVESTQVVVTLLLFGVPLMLLVVAGVTWRVTGRALAPVEGIRSEVESITTSALHRRVPVPSSGDEIARLARTMNETLARLEEGHARQRRFVSDASHELRSPVASIRQHAEVAIAHPENASAGELARRVLEEDLRIQRLVEDLLLLARLDEQPDADRAEMVDLDDVVFEEVDRLRAGTDKRVDVGGVTGGRVSGDRPRLTRLVGNLLENALRHARASVVVALQEEGDEVVLRVDDDGAGVPEAERSRVFERFVRLEEARDRDSGGAGLGLAIVAHVARAHGGSVEVLESPAGGARFEVRVPRARD